MQRVRNIGEVQSISQGLMWLEAIQQRMDVLGGYMAACEVGDLVAMAEYYEEFHELVDERDYVREQMQMIAVARHAKRQEA